MVKTKEDEFWDYYIVVLRDWAEGAPAIILDTCRYIGCPAAFVADSIYYYVYGILARLKKKVLCIEIYNNQGNLIRHIDKRLSFYRTYVDFCRLNKAGKKHCSVSVYLKGGIEVRATIIKTRRRNGKEK